MGSLWPVSGTPEEILALLRDWDSAMDEPESLVVETSGSTGRPKRVVLSRRAMRASADATHERLGGPGQWMLALPPTYVAGLQVLFRSVRAGTDPVVFESGADLEAVTGPRTYISLVPTQLYRMTEDAFDAKALGRYDAVLVGGGPLHPEERADAESMQIRVVQTYGMSETCGGCVYDGVPLEGVQVRIGDEDRVLLGGPTLFDGYEDDPQLTEDVLRDGWFRTDDLGSMDDGRLVISGRADDVIISGGIKVPASAVERMLLQHPSIRDVAVLGVPDAEWGQQVVAVVVFEGVTPTADEMRDQVSPREWAPKAFVAVPQLPQLANGKVDRLAVRRLLADG